MYSTTEKRPWEKLQDLLKEKNSDALEKYIASLIPSDIARSISRLSPDDQKELLLLISPGDAAELMEEIPHSQAAYIIEMLSASDAAAIINKMPSDTQADLLGALSTEDAEAILAKLDSEEASDVRNLIGYDEDVAGGLMVTEYVSFNDNAIVQQVVEDMSQHAEEYSDYNVQYVYVTAMTDTFVGVLRLRDLLLSSRKKQIAEIMLKDPLYVYVNTSLDELIDFFDEHDFFGVPVVDAGNRLRGVVLRTDVSKAAAERSDSDHMKSRGIVGGEELRTMPLMLRTKRRLSWLSVNILLNLAAASVIALYQDTLSMVIALAVFLPIISDMSGCSGNQAVAVSMRELSLGIVKPFEVVRVWLQEISVGIINGFVLGILVAMAAYIWKGNFYLGIVVGSAMLVNTMVAVSIGGTIPLILKKMNLDPALASSPILTTITDMFGFFLVLSIASLMLPYLV